MTPRGTGDPDAQRVAAHFLESLGLLPAASQATGLSSRALALGSLCAGVDAPRQHLSPSGLTPTRGRTRPWSHHGRARHKKQKSAGACLSDDVWAPQGLIHEPRAAAGLIHEPRAAAGGTIRRDLCVANRVGHGWHLSSPPHPAPCDEKEEEEEEEEEESHSITEET
jgi:hypothetical protein